MTGSREKDEQRRPGQEIEYRLPGGMRRRRRRRLGREVSTPTTRRSDGSLIYLKLQPLLSVAMAAATNFLQLHFARALVFPSLRPPSRPSCILPTPSSRRPSLAAAAAGGGPLDPAVAAVVDPARANANVLFFHSGYNVQIVVDETESEEALLRRFRREVSKAGVIQECKRRRFFENKQEEKKRKAREASRRNRRRRSGPRFPSSPAENESTPKAREDQDDNWDLPEGDLPY